MLPVGMRTCLLHASRPLLALLAVIAACSTATPGGRLPDAAVGHDAEGASCTPNPCLEAHRTTCVTPLGVVECRCDAGYEEQAGTCVLVTTCASDTCRGHGVCSIGAAGPECACTLGYAGTFCDGCDDALGYYGDGQGGCTKDACTPNPCLELGRTSCTVVDHHAVCGCDAGTHDEAGACVPDLTCLGTSCAGHGTCSISGGATSCACDAGWGGAHCDRCDDLGGYHADARGCIVRDVPQPPGPSTPCRSYVCNEATHAFTVQDRPAGASCDDGIACTSGDACDDHGRCAGSPSAACDPSAGVCSATSAWPSTIDVGVAPVTGQITQNGAAMAMTTDSYENGVVWARARDTGKLHRLAVLDWTRNGSYPSYTRTVGSDQIKTTLVPGVYDLLWQRAYQISGDYVSERMRAPTLDPVVNGYRVLAVQVVVPVGGRTLDVDVGATVVTGTVTQNGAAMATTTDSYENGVVWARARDTGKLHRIAVLDWTRNGSYPNYTRSAGSDAINTMLVPGAYDVLWQRGYQSSGDYVSERMRAPTADPVVNGYRVLAENVTITGAAQVLNVDVGATVVTGLVTQSGATMPLVTDAYENGVVWARARDTGKLHRIAVLDWTRNGSYPNYTRSAGSDAVNTMLVPGAYDLLWQRAYQSSGDYVSEQMRAPTVDPVVNGYRVLATCVSVE